MSGERNLGDRSSQPSSILDRGTLELLGIEDLRTVSVQTDWHRGGSETYVTDFIVSREGARQHLIAKACIKLNPVETVQEWLFRRSILQNAGVAVPDLIAVSGANIIEEYIPYDLKSLFSNSDIWRQSLLRSSYANTYAAIFRSGFSPLSLHDLRSRGDDVVVVDFGEDLGGYSESREGQTIPNGLIERSFDKFTS